MAEKRLSEELRFCIEQDGCSKYSCFETQSKLTCPGLLQKAYEVVKRYEEMEEQGKMINLPFQTEDEVWVIDERKVFRCKLKSIEIFNYGAFALVEKNAIYERIVGYIRVPITNFGKTIFLSKEAAEKALKEMEDRKNGN